MIGRFSRGTATFVYVEGVTKRKYIYYSQFHFGRAVGEKPTDAWTLMLIDRFKNLSGIPEDKPSDIAAADLQFLPLDTLVA
ncbi:hypothetical protein [Paenibacillus lautus]|uniref:hypothetical protein n=1 Tax=Paenibacillus lautus TaxID=1401 RepID=UPI001C7D5BFD|nr:hypothetical protein [Paenibacillus lautus]